MFDLNLLHLIFHLTNSNVMNGRQFESHFISSHACVKQLTHIKNNAMCVYNAFCLLRSSGILLQRSPSICQYFVFVFVSGFDMQKREQQRDIARTFCDFGFPLHFSAAIRLMQK